MGIWERWQLQYLTHHIENYPNISSAESLTDQSLINISTGHISNTEVLDHRLICSCAGGSWITKYLTVQQTSRQCCESYNGGNVVHFSAGNAPKTTKETSWGNKQYLLSIVMKSQEYKYQTMTKHQEMSIDRLEDKKDRLNLAFALNYEYSAIKVIPLILRVFADWPFQTWMEPI